MSPYLSIITPCLNAEKTIKQTIDSVFQQEHHGIEYIIIDGGSTDGTLDIVKEYAQKLEIIVSEPDQGISDAFNKGIALAKGDYIAIINADDYYEPGAFNTIVATALEHNQPDVIHGGLRYIPISGDSYLEQPNIERIWRYMSVFHPTMFIHRRAYESIGLYRLDFRFAMDSEWVHRAIANRLRFVQSNNVISNMRLGGASHKYLLRSLLEFRQSAIAHGNNRKLANFYFGRQLIIQTLININWVKRLLLYRRHIIRPHRP
ncbi:glycosyltransferase family 2 protein [Oceanicoccus sp. KOV_DT_Chl]|uniref:glycosyltransferase family 2 protein n=1 Tax=Oceanicoccus sp. KOV_DT_Chl TaxID=1904639 RepID=UPI000C7E4392|nr:glycosyltransferase family 2 protein [Oceanicoccus sp. KOV_DT_Chl]